jgi:purine nucleoside phosphorylase
MGASSRLAAQQLNVLGRRFCVLHQQFICRQGFSHSHADKLKCKPRRLFYALCLLRLEIIIATEAACILVRVERHS